MANRGDRVFFFNKYGIGEFGNIMSIGEETYRVIQDGALILDVPKNRVLNLSENDLREATPAERKVTSAYLKNGTLL